MCREMTKSPSASNLPDFLQRGTTSFLVAPLLTCSQPVSAPESCQTSDLLVPQPLQPFPPACAPQSLTVCLGTLPRTGRWFICAASLAGGRQRPKSLRCRPFD